MQESDIRNKGESLLNPGVLSAVTKSLAKRVPSLSPSALSTPEKASHNASPGPQPSSIIVDSENLEDSMKKVRSPRSHEVGVIRVGRHAGSSLCVCVYVIYLAL